MENYKVLMKEIKDLSKWRESPCSQIGRVNIFKYLVLSKLINTFNAITIKISPTYFVDNNAMILKLSWRTQILKRQPNIEDEEQSWRADITNLITYYKATIIKME